MKITRWIGLAALIGVLVVGRTIAAETSGQERAEAAGKGLVGSPAPRMVIKTIDSETIDLGALYGKKAVYLKFWATWCVPCREQMPHFEHTYETAGPDLAVIAINAGFDDSFEEIEKYRRALGITMPIVLDDGQLGAAFNLRVMPQHIVIGRDGRIQYVGHLADARLDAALLAARQPVAASATARSAPALAERPRINVGDHLPAQSGRTLANTQCVKRHSTLTRERRPIQTSCLQRKYLIQLGRQLSSPSMVRHPFLAKPGQSSAPVHSQDPGPVRPGAPPPGVNVTAPDSSRDNGVAAAAVSAPPRVHRAPDVPRAVNAPVRIVRGYSVASRQTSK